MDTAVADTASLVSLLEMRFGVHHSELAAHERTAIYYAALGKYLKGHPHNILAASFNLAGLATANSVLAWRDELRNAGWHFQGSGISGRLDAIIGTEAYFKDGINEYSGNAGYCDMADRTEHIISLMRSRKAGCYGLTVSLPCSIELLRPMDIELIKAMEECGAETKLQPTTKEDNSNLGVARNLMAGLKHGKIRLRPKEEDQSLLIWKFADETSANEYLAYMDMNDVDVWINADNKQMDNWLYLTGKPLTGSSMDGCCPQLAQMFVIGVNMFESPLNVNTLLEWLNMPVHPFDKFSRKKLADTIASEGGYRNDACASLIKDYVDGKYAYLDEEQRELTPEEQDKLRGKGRNVRKRLATMFLPDMKPQETFSINRLKDFAAGLSSWSSQQAHLISENGGSLLWSEQLLDVASMADSFMLLLDSTDTAMIDGKMINSWLSTIYRKGSFTNTVPEQGCRIVTDSPSKLVSIAGKTVWMGVDGDEGQPLDCSFLSRSEREGLVNGGYVKIWNEDNERRYHEHMQRMALMKTSGQLILVTCERRGGESTQKHPLIVRLEQLAENIGDITERPHISADDTVPALKIVRPATIGMIEFDHSELIRWPGHLSPTAVDTLVKYPFDYLMGQLLHIEEDGKALMADVKTTMGNVAHAMIERLFAPRYESNPVSYKEIRQRLDTEFENVCLEIMEAKGAVLLLPENKLDGRLFREQIKKCLEVLLEIIHDNKLKVVACERFVKDNMRLGLPEKKDSDGNVCDYDMVGFIDMTLEDAQGNPVIFDFKWTSSKKYYPDLLLANRSIQLEMYRRMLSKETRKDVERTAYFLMPEARLYSKEYFNGVNCTQLIPENNDNIVEEVRNSILYRKEQLSQGMAETNGEFETLQYVNDTKIRNLFPLERDNSTGEKRGNIFSNYNILLS